VQFKGVNDVERLVRELDNLWIESMKLHVNISRLNKDNQHSRREVESNSRRGGNVQPRWRRK